MCDYIKRKLNVILLFNLIAIVFGTMALIKWYKVDQRYIHYFAMGTIESTIKVCDDNDKCEYHGLANLTVFNEFHKNVPIYQVKAVTFNIDKETYEEACNNKTVVETLYLKDYYNPLVGYEMNDFTSRTMDVLNVPSIISFDGGFLYRIVLIIAMLGSAVVAHNQLRPYQKKKNR